MATKKAIQKPEKLSRRFEYVDKKSSKFWEITVGGSDVDVRYGKIGTNGQKIKKAFSDAASASIYAEKLVAEKLGKGYRVAGTSAVTEVPRAEAVARQSQKSTLVPKVPAAKALALNRKKVLVGDFPEVLDLRSIAFKHEGVICIADSEAVVSIHLPDATFDSVLVENLPNLREIHAYGSGPTWLNCKNLPNLKSVILDRGTLWLSFQDVASLQSIDARGCESLGYLAVQDAPDLQEIRVDQCRLLEKIHGLSLDVQKAMGVTQQIETIQKSSKKDLSVYEGMTFTDINFVLSGIRRGEELLKQSLLSTEEGSGSNDDEDFPCDYRYRLLGPGETVNTGGTGESYCYAFEVSHEVKSRKKVVIQIVEERGIHEPEESITEAVNWTIMGLGLPSEKRPSESQFLVYLRYLLSSPAVDVRAWVVSSDVSLRQELAGNPLLPATALDLLALDEDSRVRLAVAENAAASVELRRSIFHRLAGDSDSDVRFAVANNPHTDPKDLVELARDQDEKVLCAVAVNRATPTPNRVAILDALSESNDPISRLVAAGNGDTSAMAFSRILGKPNEKIFIAIADNAAAPDDLRSLALDFLAKRDDIKVKLAVASNLMTSQEALDSLAKEVDVGLLQAVAGNPKTSPSSFQHLMANERLRQFVAGNPGAPSTVLETLATDKDDMVREGVAKNPMASTNALEILAKDRNSDLRSCVASHPAASAEILTALAADTDYGVRVNVKWNPATPVSVRELLEVEFENARLAWMNSK